MRSAEDGPSALVGLQKEVPNILLTDLNMPGMTGFELLRVVRRRFPLILTIAMGGAYSAIEAPSEVAADAFYPKGSSVASLLRLMGNCLCKTGGLPAFQPCRHHSARS
jgi:CheY-like chemotaxis protein